MVILAFVFLIGAFVIAPGYFYWWLIFKSTDRRLNDHDGRG